MERFSDTRGLGRDATKGLYEAIIYRNRCLRKQGDVTEEMIGELNGRILKYVAPDVAGQYRKMPAFISDGGFVPSGWEKIPQKMRELIEKLDMRLEGLSSRQEDVTEVIKAAAWAHCRLAKIQPFVDGNKRTSRMVANFILMKYNLPAIANWNPRDEYLDHLYHSLRKEHEGPFAHFMAEKISRKCSELEIAVPKSSASILIIRDRKTLLEQSLKGEFFRSEVVGSIKTL